MANKQIALLILAAGGSSRMGTPKQLLPWNELTLLAHVIDTALGIKDTKAYVVLGANSDLIRATIGQKKVKWLTNKDWEAGLGSSLSFGMKAILDNRKTVEGILVLLADQPYIDESFIEQMIHKFQTGQKGLVATVYKQGVGVPALFDQKYFQELIGLKPDNGAKDILIRHRLDIEFMHANGKEKDIDTLEDYEKLMGLKK